MLEIFEEAKKTPNPSTTSAAAYYNIVIEKLGRLKKIDEMVGTFMENH
jgi:hypothetical protein